MKDAGYRLKGVPLTGQEVEDYYYGFSNEILWPLFHDLQTRANFDPAYWSVYRQVNRKFGRVVRRNLEGRDLVWVHDYHLIHVGEELRAAGADNRLVFFLHTPFPPFDIFLKLPWREDLLRALLVYDLIGFQTLRDRRNFLQCLRHLLGLRTPRAKSQVVEIEYEGRTIRVGHFAISIDFEEFARQASSSQAVGTMQQIHEELPRRQLMLGIDRLDYTKGIPLRLEAYRCALDRYPDLRGNVCFIQVVSPSRKALPHYQEQKAEVDQLVGEIHGAFTRPDWVPIHYVTRPMGRMELVGYYRACEVALVTPLKDGMNLVAKEYCAAKVDEDGVLILSEFAGAADQLGPTARSRGAMLVNPYDTEGVADAIHQAFPDGRARAPAAHAEAAIGDPSPGHLLVGRHLPPRGGSGGAGRFRGVRLRTGGAGERGRPPPRGSRPGPRPRSPRSRGRSRACRG